MDFNALFLEKNAGTFSARVTRVSHQALMEQPGDTLIRVDFSTLNYKDALTLTNSSPVVRAWPMIPGIDCAGTVQSSSGSHFKVGDKVILNGWGAGEVHWGGLAEYAHLKSEWLIALPSSITSWQAMALGTAGYTAALCVQRILLHGIKPEDGSILVTGATGGVGSVAIVLLSALGFDVIACTGKAAEQAYLMKLGATALIDRATLEQSGNPLQKERWAAAVDTAGSQTLANLCAQTRYGGIVAACGLAQGFDLPATVMPFILRNVTLAGVDSVMAPQALRQAAWKLLEEKFRFELLDEMVQTIALADALSVSEDIMKGRVRGRYVVKVN